MSNQSRLFSPLSPLKKQPRQVFVAYPYRTYNKSDYRRVFDELEKAFDIEFMFADEKITNLHILEKIQNYIQSSQFGIYDITTWNANVTLELGLAMGMGERAYIAFDPKKTDINEVPSDLRGIDRVQYSSYTELGNELGRLLADVLPVPKTHEAENQLENLRATALNIIDQAGAEGLKIADIAAAIGVSVDLAKLVVRPLVGGQLSTKGIRKGTRYMLT